MPDEYEKEAKCGYALAVIYCIHFAVSGAYTDLCFFILFSLAYFGRLIGIAVLIDLILLFVRLIRWLISRHKQEYSK